MGRRGSLKFAPITRLDGDRLIMVCLWIDREAFPGQPLFNPVTEGCLPMSILLADSPDGGETWSPWRVVPMPADVGPPSLTNAAPPLPERAAAAEHRDEQAVPRRFAVVPARGPPLVGRRRGHLVGAGHRRVGPDRPDRELGPAWRGGRATAGWSAFPGPTTSRRSPTGRSGGGSALDEGRTVRASRPSSASPTSRAIRRILPGRAGRPRLGRSLRDAFDPRSPGGGDRRAVRRRPARSSCSTRPTGRSRATPDVDATRPATPWSRCRPGRTACAFAETLPNGDVGVVHYAPGADGGLDVRWVRLAVDG